MDNLLQQHYELYPYPQYPLLASVRRCDTYALNLDAIWARFHGTLPPPSLRRVLIAGCGCLSPYPFALANPGVEITALDLSKRSLNRAKVHCLLHGLRNVDFVRGDLCDPTAAKGPFGLIDAYGVLHHLQDPAEGLKMLAGLLGDGGVLRIMVYSRHARRQEESIRRALRILKVARPDQVLDMVRRSPQHSRLNAFFDASDEVGNRAGLADALLHPRVHTYKVDDLLHLIQESGLQPLMFAHNSALPDLGSEISRLRELEKRREAPGNFVLYLGKSLAPKTRSGTIIFRINPCLEREVSRLRLCALQIPGRLGDATSTLAHHDCRFLHMFRKGILLEELSSEDLEKAEHYARKLYLMRYYSG